jgi:ubiquinone/menaquinone biosynthesis C-methylase UbiE
MISFVVKSSIMSSTILSFGGSIAEQYEELLGPFLFEPFAADLAERIGDLPASSVLELACGTGRVTRHLAAALGPDARLVATDLNAEMLSVARKAVLHPRVSWAEADIAALPFGDAEFDLVVSQFGMMFPGDKAAAFAETRRVLRPGGRLLFNTWGPGAENPFWALLGDQMRAVFGDGAKEPIAQPFSLSDEQAVLQLLQRSGFVATSVRRLRHLASIETAALAARGMIAGLPVINLLRQRAPDALPGMLERLEARYAEAFGDRPLVAPVSAWVFEARV